MINLPRALLTTIYKAGVLGFWGFGVLVFEAEFFAEVRPVFIDHGFLNVRETLIRF